MGESQNDWQRIKVTMQYSTSAAFGGWGRSGESKGRVEALRLLPGMLRPTGRWRTH